MPPSEQSAPSKRRAPGEKDFTKRRTADEGLALSDAAHAAVWRLYCEVFPGSAIPAPRRRSKQLAIGNAVPFAALTRTLREGEARPP
jgi:hypothetical protein